MTRDERIAAGWVECWGVYDLTDGRWFCDGWSIPMSGHKRTSWSFDGATDRAMHEKCNVVAKVVVRRFWRRKKPKAPSALKVGDVVTVRFTIVGTDAAVGTGVVRAKTRSEHTFLFSQKDVDVVEVMRP